MAKITYSKDGGVGVVRMDDGKANAQNPDFFKEMIAALDQAEKDQVRSLLVLGREKFYSAGLDLKLLPTLKPDQLAEALSGFKTYLEKLYLFPAPVVGAANGHTLAGGMILYLCCDYRMAVDNGAHQYGLNEMSNGIPLSHFVIAICEGTIPSRVLTETVLLARIYTAKDAHDRGIIHELVPNPRDLEVLALEKARELARLQAPAVRLTKLRLRKAAFEAAVARDLAEGPRGSGGFNPFAGLGR